jgi:3-hydroxyisobutyrate dehydrogenase-like beta-hydroxyacid dehydrogenase
LPRRESDVELGMIGLGRMGTSMVRRLLGASGLLAPYLEGRALPPSTQDREETR